jgi:hypothetical protein
MLFQQQNEIDLATGTTGGFRQRQLNVPSTGTSSGFMNTSHYYPQAAARRPAKGKR